VWPRLSTAVVPGGPVADRDSRGPMRTIFINGKFTAQRTTGVQRAARGIVDALDRLLFTDASARAVRWILLCPPGAPVPTLRCIECRTTGRREPGLHAWEQFWLPWVARGQMLLNLAGSAPLLKRRQVCTFHDAAVFDVPEAHTWIFGVWYRFLFRIIGRRARLLLTVSAFSRDRLAARIGMAPDRMAIMQESGEHLLSIDADAGTLVRLGLRAGTYFIAVGSANPAKNFAALLKAFVDLPARFTGKLVIVGGIHRGVFAAGDWPVASDRIVQAGPVSDAELKALYQSALALVFPSVYEGFGLPPLEAMVCGCAVAASDAASIPEVCGDAALYFDPRATDAIGAAMMRLHDEPALCDDLRSRGARRAQDFSWDAAARVLIERVAPLAGAGA
jgi:glycosyltransferase involved in cell wall biosynthesis